MGLSFVRVILYLWDGLLVSDKDDDRWKWLNDMQWVYAMSEIYNPLGNQSDNKLSVNNALELASFCQMPSLFLPHPYDLSNPSLNNNPARPVEFHILLIRHYHNQAQR
jgi:hypothetical protein